MEIIERINQLIKEQNMTKREFATRLISLEPKLQSTGEIPTEKTIYKYLNNTHAIKIELISYIAETLRVTEQDLFTSDKKSRKKFFTNIIKTATLEEMEIIKEKFDLKEKIENTLNEPTQIKNKENTTQSELISLIPYAPKSLQLTLISKLKDIKEFSETI